MSHRVLYPLATLLLSALPLLANDPPVVTAPAARTLYTGGAAATLDLDSVFNDPDPGTVVQIDVRLGAISKPIQLVLFNQEKPITVANFTRYITNGLYEDNFIHRLAANFVVQGGGFKWVSDSDFNAVPTFPAITNEPGISNLRGTIAMAKLGGDPDSATSQWFINLADNSANLDGQNGGFTVFGKVINGMAVVDEIAALPTYNASSIHPAFDTLPLKDLSGSVLKRVYTVETDTKIIPPRLNYNVVSNSSLVTASVSGSTLVLTAAGSAAGAGTVTLTATDVNGMSSTAQLSVTVRTDTTPPVVSQPSPQTFEVAAGGYYEVPDFRGTLVTATDNVSVANLSQTPLPGTLVSGGSVVPLVFVASDPAGNTTRAETTLSVTFPAVTSPLVVPGSAYTGAPLPATGSTGLSSTNLLRTFGVPAVSNLRSLAARLTLSSGTKTRTAVYGEDVNGTGLFYAVQGLASGIPGGLYLNFKDPVLSPQGAVAFAAKVSGPGTNQDEGVWSNLFGSLQPLLREGTEIPGLGGLKLKSVTSLSLEGEALVVLAKLLPAPGLVTAASDTALLRLTGPNSVTLLARTGADFDGSKVTAISVLQPALYSPGQGRSQSGSRLVLRLTLANKTTAIVRLAANGTPTQLLKTGNNLGIINLKSLGLPAVGGDLVAVLGTKVLSKTVTTSNDTVLLVARTTSDLNAVAEEDAGVPMLEGARFASFADPVVNVAGDVLFRATLRGTVPATGKIGLFKKAAGGDLAPVAQSGATATDDTGAPLPGVTWTNFTAYALGDEPDSGPLFVASLAGPSATAGTKLGLWGVDGTGKPRLLLRAGKKIKLPTSNTEKTLSTFSLFKALPGSFGVRRSYNSGSVAVLATFTDKSQALLRIDVPQ